MSTSTTAGTGSQKVLAVAFCSSICLGLVVTAYGIGLPEWLIGKNARDNALLSWFVGAGTDHKGYHPPKPAKPVADAPVDGAKPLSAELKLGKQVYDGIGVCFSCHGEKGDGKGVAGLALPIKPRDYTKGIFKFTTSSDPKKMPSDADLVRVIQQGIIPAAMPPRVDITGKKLDALVAYIKHLSAPHFEEKGQGEPLKVPPIPKLTDKLAKRGLVHYQKNCLRCHGQTGKGDGPDAGKPENKVDVWGHPIKPRDLTVAIMYKWAKSDRDLFVRIRLGIPGTPMPAFPTTQISDKQAWELIAYVRRLQGALQ